MLAQCELNASFSGSHEIPGGIRTIALGVNMIPQAMNSRPDLKSMAELPVHVSIMADICMLIKEKA
jgi:hypothetical protein